MAFSKAASVGPNPTMPHRPQRPSLSINAVYLGDCSPNKPFVLRIGLRVGRGALGSMCSFVTSISVRSDHDRHVTLEGESRENFFAVNGGGVFPEETFCGIPLPLVIADGGRPSSAAVSCDADTSIIIILRDDQ